MTRRRAPFLRAAAFSLSLAGNAAAAQVADRKIPDPAAGLRPLPGWPGPGRRPAVNGDRAAPVAGWIYFTDKGIAGASALDLAMDRVRRDLDSRCLWRRLKVLDERAAVDASDLPVSASYKNAVRPLVERIRTESRWLNAVSADATPPQVRALARLPFVRTVDKVLALARGGSRRPPGPTLTSSSPTRSSPFTAPRSFSSTRPGVGPSTARDGVAGTCASPCWMPASGRPTRFSARRG